MTSRRSYSEASKTFTPIAIEPVLNQANAMSIKIC